jgi:superfamily II DNA/RNA helicase
MEVVDFKSLGIDPNLCKGLSQIGYTLPTPIQIKACHASHTNFIAQSKNGTGKTLAFLIVAIGIVQTTHRKALIITPTREIALQIKSVYQSISSYLEPQIKLLCAVGGFSIHKDIEGIDKYNPSIIVGTLGRLRALIEAKHIDGSQIGCTILDEADILIRENGFKRDVHAILKSINIKTGQFMAFSATVTAELDKVFLAKQIDYVRISEDEHSESWDSMFLKDVVQYYIIVKDCDSYSQKLDKLLNILEKCVYHQVIVFYNTKSLGLSLEKDLL